MITAKEQIKIGQLVTIDDSGNIKLLDSVKYKNIAVAMARRDIADGELIEYSPTQNTKDLVVLLDSEA